MMTSADRTLHWGDVLAQRWMALQGWTVDDHPQLYQQIRQLSLDIDQGHTCLPLSGPPAAPIGAASLQQPQPVVHDQQALYLWRHWAQEHQLARNLRRVLQARVPAVEVPR